MEIDLDLITYFCFAAYKVGSASVIEQLSVFIGIILTLGLALHGSQMQH